MLKKTSYLFFLLTSFFFLSTTTLKAETKTWDFTNPLDFNYDNTKITVSNSQAKLVSPLLPAWYNPNWNYRRAITINHSIYPYDLTNFQTEIRLTSSNFDFTKTNLNGSDIRVTDENGTTDLHYWLEDYNSASQSAIIMVELPTIPKDSAKTIYLYYGNINATSTNSWTATFTGSLPSTHHDIYSDGTYNSFPSMVRLSNGDILATFRSGSAHQSPDGKIMLSRSTDNGDTWTTTTIYDDPAYDDRVNIGMAVLSNGDILLPIFKYTPPSSQGGFVLKSTDNGINWSLITIQNQPQIAMYGKIIELPDGKLLAPAYYAHDGISNALLLESSDHGDTWSSKSTIAEANSTSSFNETSVLRLSETNYLAIARGNTSTIYQTNSTDGGTTWSTPVFLFDGVSPDLLKTSNGSILLCVGDRDGIIHGIRCYTSNNNGQSWTNGTMIYGTNSAISKNLGYPTTIEMPDSSLSTAYYYEDSNHKVNVAITKYRIVNNKIYLQNDNSLNFLENIDSGNLDNWTTVQPKNQNSTASTAQKHSPNYSFLLKDQSAGNQTRGDLRLYNNPQDTGTVSFWIYPTLSPNGIQFGLLSDGTKATNRMFWFSIESDHSLKYYNGQTNSLLPLPIAGSVNFNVWSKIELKFDIPSNQSEILVNGVTKGKIGAWNVADGVRYVEFTSASIPAIGDLFYIDDIYTHQYTSFSQETVINSQTSQYPTDNPSISPISSGLQKVTNFLNFSEDALKDGGEIKYQVSNDLGTTWYWYNNGWISTNNDNYQETNTSIDIDSHIATFPIGTGQFIFRAYLHSNGAQFVRLNSINLGYSGWVYKKVITFNNQDSDEDLINFPILVKLTASNFNFTQAQNDGRDIRFFDSTNQTALKYKIENWNTTNQTAAIWVQVPEIENHSTNNNILMYWGNSQAQNEDTVNGWEHSSAWMHASYKVANDLFLNF